MARSQPVRRARMGLPLKDHDPSVTRLAPLFDESIEKKRRKISPATEKNYRCAFEPLQSSAVLVPRRAPVVLASSSKVVAPWCAPMARQALP